MWRNGRQPIIAGELMNIYIVVADFDATITKAQQKKLERYGTVFHITHHGRLSELAELTKDPEEKILALSPTAFDWKLDMGEVEAIPNVKAVITQSTSFDWINPTALKKQGIIACNCPGFSSESVAEYAFAMAIDVSRRLPLIMKNNWKADANMGSVLLSGKTLGVVGLGRIGRAMAAKGKGLGMHVLYWSQNSRTPDYEYADLPDLFRRADVLMPALAVNDDTAKLITKEHVDTLKPTAVVVGIGRVKNLLPQEHILAKVAKNELGGFAIEGGDTKPFTEYEGNVWALPAIAWITNESMERLVDIWVENMIAAATGKPKNVINR